MRLLVTRIYRAFPELDRYSDEHCIRFVRAARRGWLRSLGRGCIIAAVAIIGVSISAVGLAFVSGVSESWPRTPAQEIWRLIGQFILAIPLVAVCPLAAYYTRDFLLRRRIHYILRARGVCAGCHYSLIGLPVSESHRVTCPECGFEGEVDPSLGELVRDNAGNARFQPSARSSRPPRIFTEKRVRILKRSAKWAALALLVGAPAGWGGYELWLRHQASVATRERPGVPGMLAYIESNQPAGTSAESPDAWSEFFRVQSALMVANQNALSVPVVPGKGPPRGPDFSRIFSAAPEGDFSPEQIAEWKESATTARMLLGVYRDMGVYDGMMKMAQSPRSVRSLSLPPGDPMVNVLLPELGQARHMARINAARMFLAQQARDRADFVAAAEVNFALARMCRTQAFLIERLVALAIEAMTYERIRTLLETHPGETWLHDIDAAIDRQSTGMLPGTVFEGERLAILDTVAWMFSDPKRARWGRFSPELRVLAGGPSFKPLGTYARNRDVFNTMFQGLEARANQAPWQRSAVPDFANPENLALVDLLMPSMTRMLASEDQVELDRRAYRIMAALERFRAQFGDYPRRLDELSLARGPLPADPWSGRNFGYIRVNPADDPQGRSYLLYSVGADGVDNGGNTKPGGKHYEILSNSSGSNFMGYDFIINDRQR